MRLTHGQNINPSEIKHHLLELGRDQATAMRTSASPQSASILDDQKKNYETEMARYDKDEKELQTKARDLEAKYDALNYRDDQLICRMHLCQSLWRCWR